MAVISHGGSIHTYLVHSGNELSQVEGIEGLQELMELVLDRNKIKVCISGKHV